MSFRTLFFFVLAVLLSPLAYADGFAVKDLTRVSAQAQAALGTGYAHRAESQRLILGCNDCEGQPMVDVQLGRQDDGTEQRMRSGETTIAKLEAICQARNPSCRISSLEVGTAVGWLSTYSAGPRAGSTAIVLRDGDLLTIRSVAADEATARRNAEKVLGAIWRAVVGR